MFKCNGKTNNLNFSVEAVNDSQGIQEIAVYFEVCNH